MKNWILAAVLALAVLAFAPETSRAFWNMPQSSAGYPCLAGWSINMHPAKFFEGPLYNYGPIVPGPGYQLQYVQQHLCGLYIPADPNTYIPLNYQDPNSWGYVNPGIAGTPGSLPAYYGLYYGSPGPAAPPPMSSQPVISTPAPTTTPAPAPKTPAPMTTAAPTIVQSANSASMAMSSSDPITQPAPIESSGSPPLFFKNLRARLQR